MLDFSCDFGNQSWADMVEKEHKRKEENSEARLIKSPRKRLNLTPVKSKEESPKKTNLSPRKALFQKEFPALGEECVEDEEGPAQKKTRKAAAPKKVESKPK